MSLSIEDLKPQDKIITVGGVEVTCKPLRLSHALVLTQMGEIFQNPKNAKYEDMQKAEQNMDKLLSELIPELAGVNLDLNKTMEILTQMMVMIEPADNKELRERGVKFDNDPKAGTIG